MVENARAIPLILSGGQGARLWPLSRPARPKQFLPLVPGEPSPFAQAVARAGNPALFAPPVAVCAQAHRFLAAEALSESGARRALVVCEPAPRSTGPAIAAGVLAALADGRAGPGSPVLAMPCDHRIPDIAAFQKTVRAALPLAAEGAICVFGVVPTGPETGFGYIERGAARGAGYAVAAFHEKPDAATAARYLAARGHYWNAGIFLARADVLLAALEAHAPDVLAAARAAVQGAHEDLGALRLDAAAFARARAVSFDVAVMERTDRAAVVPADFAWSDLGTWGALWDAADRDADGVARVGDVVALDARGSYLHAEAGGPLLCALGVQDMVAVATRDAVLIAPRARAQEVRGVLEALRAQGRAQAEAGPEVHRPWGRYETLEERPGFKVKRIVVAPGRRLSLQRHAHRSEHWVVVRGTARVTCGAQIFDLDTNRSAYIPCGAVHRLENPGGEPLEIIEVQSGAYLGEDDIVRLEDDFRREGDRVAAHG
jgi:mannose-1-phosphate guanylyltransferase/mannose-6-phosphate isomerase